MLLRHCLCILLLAGLARGERKTIALGLLGGVSGSSFWGKDVDAFDAAVWPTTGFSLALHLPVFIGLETDLLYTSKGASFSSKENGKIKVNTIKAHCLEIPLMIKITAPTGNEVQPIFFGGPSIARIVKKDSYTEYITVGQGGTITPEDAIPLIEAGNLVDYDFSLAVGGGLEWGLGTFQMRFNLGEQSLDKTEAKDVRTFTLAIMAGFVF